MHLKGLTRRPPRTCSLTPGQDLPKSEHVEYPRFNPHPPQDYDSLDIPQTLVVDLMVRRLMLEGFSSIHSLCDSLKLSARIIEQTFRHLRQQQLVEVKGMSGNDYQFVLSQAGKQLASDRFQVSQYAGACPVSLKEYSQAVRAQTARVRIDRTSLRRAFSDLVIRESLLDQLGPALISQNSIFLYGPSGNGKTSVAERMLRVYGDYILIPHAIEVDGQIISLYDPVVHEAVQADHPDLDPRWVLCRRPCIIVGGELVPSMLELRLDDSTGIYAAPLQLKASNGIFIVDDFGRQLISPRDLLNRWIVPLDRRVDYLTLRYGVKFQVPFEMMVVFSTNLDPRDLADEAFLRRIQNKVLIECIDGQSFDAIFDRVAENRKIITGPASAEALRRLCQRFGSGELRACYPNDICSLLLSISQYENRPAEATEENLERAAQLYFARTEMPITPHGGF
ncbi:MAG: AAA family ATPase [Acidobacteria bacterium]|nr:AAA family ATPase [Acidobacteriota bacterium]